MVQICDDILNQGVCHRLECPYSHDVLPCQTCRMVFTDNSAYEAHLQTTKHSRRLEQNKKRTAGLSQTVLCTICNVELPSASQYLQHASGRRHVLNMAQRGLSPADDPGPEEVDVPKNNTRCDICSTNIPNYIWDKHVKGVRHREAGTYNALRGALDESEKNKNGVLIKDCDAAIDFGILEYIHGRSPGLFKHCTVENSNSSAIYVSDARVSSCQTSRAKLSHFRLSDIVKGRRIGPYCELRLNVEFCSRSERGSFEDRLELIFEDPALNRRFAITRPLLAIVGVKADYEALKAIAPYVRPKLKPEVKMGDVIHGVPPQSIAEIEWKVKLDFYKPPKSLLDVAFDAGSPKQVAARVRKAFLPETFTDTTYGRHFATLLWIEEERARRDLQMYDMEDATLSRDRRRPKYFELQVDGLAEKRPSVIVTDRVIVRESGLHGSRAYEGHVHAVKDKSVLLQFHSSFNPIKGQKFFVRFDLNRNVYRRMHQALGTAFSLNRVLFPQTPDLSGLHAPSPRELNAIRTIDREIQHNPPQLEAVTAIVNRPPGSVPIIVFGPPGKGKTVTIVEAIRQIIQFKPGSRILACAPSNSAGDLITERLAALGKSQLFRLNAPSRNKEPVSNAVLAFSKYNSDGLFCFPQPEELAKFRVIVSTCFSASVPYGIGMKRGHFTHIFVDEAGQATEPEVMIPIKDNADKQTNIILAGDSKQLGPIVRSPLARELGLGKSFLDRLMSNGVFDEKEGKGITIVKLVKNWRSHPSILKFPNDEFYRGELEAHGNPAITHSLLRWDGLASNTFPIVFHGISGKDEREASSPSFFNIAEASLVKEYVEDLLDDNRFRLKPEHIGVISPYHAQVSKIRNVLPRNAREIKVGSVEEYQGQERRVIIVSTVRSSMEFVSFDLRHTLGFVANPRRFNVSITRAQALLIVIGDPVVLSLDPLWKTFLNYVHLNGGWKGKTIDWDPREDVYRLETHSMTQKRRLQGISDLDALIARTKEEILSNMEDLAGGGGDDMEGNADKPWREDD